MRVTVGIVFLTFAVFSGCTEKAASQQNRHWEVCDVLRKVKEVNRRTIIVRGLVTRGYMRDCRLAGCPDMPETKFRLNLLYVVPTEYLPVEEEDLPAFRTDDSYEGLLKKIGRSREFPGPSVVVSIEGEIRTREGLGYGQLNLSPAMLVVKRILAAKPAPIGKGLSSFCDE